MKLLTHVVFVIKRLLKSKINDVISMSIKCFMTIGNSSVDMHTGMLAITGL